VGVKRKGKLPQYNLALVDVAMEGMMRDIGEFGVKFAAQRRGSTGIPRFENQTFNLQDSYGYAVYNRLQ